MRLGTLKLSLCHCMSSWTSWWLRPSQPRGLLLPCHSPRNRGAPTMAISQCASYMILDLLRPFFKPSRPRQSGGTWAEAIQTKRIHLESNGRLKPDSFWGRASAQPLLPRCGA
ncbi:hypothetical protein HMPREF0298_2129 [Corynebacterium lipophiloflavum DSM 44291]|uniref:Uncharacterized protein n=1 Tax=Corynebacterium lipophiloflavum (strain ATCC 700352 / DSM 44291 / CCUG 37336 / JCM 10383 / DMMZ 1944) TaxID=525263 RepID=C0XUK9_CORLD|nr:hypothetical protein HMPREF0298_2129 [Corynebacterium lipophiloflavum DSM 44291]